jgi:hypothetical protein
LRESEKEREKRKEDIGQARLGSLLSGKHGQTGVEIEDK